MSYSLSDFPIHRLAEGLMKRHVCNPRLGWLCTIMGATIVILSALLTVQTQPIFPEPERIEYPVYIHDADPWKSKCQDAWRALKEDRNKFIVLTPAEEKAWKILDQ